MTKGLTYAYITSRCDSKIEWFMDSLFRQFLLPNHVIVIDRYAENGRSRKAFEKAFAAPLAVERGKGNDLDRWLTVSEPKPNVWSGPHRLTKEDWFSAASARNTAICLCQTSHVCFVDDLSVLPPHTGEPWTGREGVARGWVEAIWLAVEGNYIACGAYKKVQKLVVDNGFPVSYIETESGTDDRLRRVDKDLSECDGGWLYGCSMVAPLEDLLEVGGFPEFCDGLGSEDYCLGIALRNAGKHLKFDRRMLTLESEELHFAEPPMRRTDKGVSPNDKSHAALRLAQGSKYFPNYYEGGIRALRDYVQAGNPFPVVGIPTHDWFDGQPIAEMT